MNDQIPRTLKRLGMILFLLGLITGFSLNQLKNPRMGLAGHLEGIMNGMFLIVVGLFWKELMLSETLKKIAYVTLLYGTFINWFTTLLAACFGTSKITPITGSSYTGSEFQEQIVTAGFISVGLTMVTAVVIIIFGLRNKRIKVGS